MHAIEILGCKIVNDKVSSSCMKYYRIPDIRESEVLFGHGHTFVLHGTRSLGARNSFVCCH